MADTSTVVAADRRRSSDRTVAPARVPSLAAHAAFVVPLGGGLAAWAVSVAELHLSAVGLYGLLDAVSAWFFVGIGLLVGGFALEISRIRPRQWVLGLYIVALVVVIHATVPLLSRAPEYSWVYKHIGVARTFAADGRVTNGNNIYQDWPALFAALAGISKQSGVSVFAIARWAPLAFELLDCLMLFGVYRMLTRDARVPALAVVIFEVLVAWVGQDYLSPQAFDYVLWLGFVLIMVRWLLTTEIAATRFGILTRLHEYVRRDADVPLRSDAGRQLAVAVALLIFAAIVVTHQLTPYIALAAIGMLTVLDLLRPRWLLLATAALAIAYVIPHYTLIQNMYGGLFGSFDVVANGAGHIGVAASAAETFTANCVRVLAVACWLVAVGIVVRAWRAPGRIAVPAVLAFSPFVVLFAQAYGGEAIYRVFLFSAPWCALLIASAVYRLRAAALRFILVGLGVGVALMLSLQGLYGAVAVDTFTQTDVTTGLWIYDHVPVGSTVLLGASNFPLSDVPNPGRYTVTPLPDDAQLGPVTVNGTSLASVDRFVRGLNATNAYLVLSPSMLVYARYYDSPTGLPTLMRELPTARDWTLYYRSGDVRVYRFR
ncbi:MAG TPA: hypothetical protein VHM72_07045 [Solirubrobacteraceae bacterium]|nr:hypothetical protein [Solirubrobacteraceae bacterium]